MSRETTLEAFVSLRRGNEGIAPHKPLLALYALTQWLLHDTRKFPFSIIRHPLRELIRDPLFGGDELSDPRLPFFHLTNDGIWVVETPEGHPIHFAEKRPTTGELLDQHAVGRFSEAVFEDLLQNRPAWLWN